VAHLPESHVIDAAHRSYRRLELSSRIILEMKNVTEHGDDWNEPIPGP
jgi:hypothetical protein